MSGEDLVDADSFFAYAEKHKETTGPCLEEFYSKLEKNCNDPLKLDEVEEITRNNPQGITNYWADVCGHRIRFSCIDGNLIVTNLTQLTGYETDL